LVRKCTSLRISHSILKFSVSPPQPLSKGARSPTKALININKRCLSARATLSNSKSLASIKVPTALKFKARPAGKRTDTPGKDEWSVAGYSSVENLDLLGLAEALENQLVYTRIPLSSDLEPHCLCVTNSFSIEPLQERKEIFFFKVGCVVFWNVPELERHAVLKYLKDYNEDSGGDLVFEESEMMTYCVSKTENSHLDKGVINLSKDADMLVKYTFSNAISSSVKLGAWESSLDRLIDSIEFIHDDLRRLASIRVEQAELLKKTGEILALRHLINLSSDLLDTPDFYWDREVLEGLFNATCGHLALRKRTSVVNEKISHCLELIEIIKNQRSNDQGHRLEKIIIALIAIEIVFELIHFIDRFRS